MLCPLFLSLYSRLYSDYYQDPILIIYFKQQIEKVENMSINMHQANNTLYLSNFPPNVEKSLLAKRLQQYGPLLSLNIIQRQGFAFAFAEFDDLRDAAYAVKDLNQKLFQGMNIKVQFRANRGGSKQDCYDDKLKIQTNRQGKSPISTLETSCNITSKNQKQKYQKLKKSSSPNRNNQSYRKQSIKKQPYGSGSRSRSRSDSRSRVKRYKQDRYRSPARGTQSYRDYSYNRQKQSQRYLSEQQQIKRQKQLKKILENIKQMEKGMRCLREQVQDLIFVSDQRQREARRKN